MTSHVRDSKTKFSRSFVTPWETKLLCKIEDFIRDFDLAFEMDKLFEENDDIFEANDLPFSNSINKETKPVTNKFQEDTGPNIPASNPDRFAVSENEDGILTDAESRNTKQQTKWAMNVFKG